jgi:hypothetical protein
MTFSVRRKYFIGLVLAAALTLLTSLSPSLYAHSHLAPRLQIGINLLPAIIAANNNLTNQLDDENRLPVYILYKHNHDVAEKLTQQLTRVGHIHNYQLLVTIVAADSLLLSNGLKPATVFIVEPMNDRLDKIVNFAQKNRMLLFSPFKGDIQRGVMTGFRVTDRVLPMVNLESLRQARINLKAFFLRIAVKYE